MGYRSKVNKASIMNRANCGGSKKSGLAPTVGITNFGRAGPGSNGLGPMIRAPRFIPRQNPDTPCADASLPSWWIKSIVRNQGMCGGIGQKSVPRCNF